MDSKNDLKTAVCKRPAHQTGIKSQILWVEVPYAPSATTGEAFQTGLDTGHNGGMELKLTTLLSLFGNSHFFSYLLYFHYLHIYFLIFIPNSIIFPIHPLVISWPTFHLTLLSFHWSNISLSPSLTPLFPAYKSPSGTFILNSPFHLSPFLCSALHSTGIYARTHRFPFCSCNSSFQNTPQYLCHAHSVAVCTCLPCMCPFCLP